MNAIPKIPVPTNEPVLSYAPVAPERIELKRTLKDLSSHQIEIPLLIGGKEVRTGKTIDAVMPHCHRHVLAKVHQAGPAEVQAAIRAAREAWLDWSTSEFERRAAVFLKAADLLATRYRPIVNAATMLGQSKTAHQAEIDAACELIDFFRFNGHFAERLYAEQPISASGSWNYLDYRPLEGFVYAITPFNFTSIGGNLPTSPAIMGNTVVWKPAAAAVLSNYFVMKLLEDAGLGAGRGGPRVRRDPLHRLDRGVPGAVAAGVREPDVLRGLPAARGGDRRQGFHRRAPERRRRRARDGAGARRLRVPGTEVQRGVARLCPGRPLGPPARARARDAGGGEGGRPGGLPELHGRGDRPECLRQDQGLPGSGAASARRDALVRRRRERRGRLLHRADPHSDGGPPLPHHVRGDLRAGAVAVRVSRGPVDRDPAPRGRDIAVRAHRRDLRAGPARGHRGPERVAVRRRQLLRERQADRRRRGAAAIRRSARQRHRRQGGKPAQP